MIKNAYVHSILSMTKFTNYIFNKSKYIFSFKKFLDYELLPIVILIFMRMVMCDVGLKPS